MSSCISSFTPLLLLLLILPLLSRNATAAVAARFKTERNASAQQVCRPPPGFPSPCLALPFLPPLCFLWTPEARTHRLDRFQCHQRAHPLLASSRLWAHLVSPFFSLRLGFMTILFMPPHLWRPVALKLHRLCLICGNLILSHQVSIAHAWCDWIILFSFESLRYHSHLRCQVSYVFLDAFCVCYS